MYYYEFFFLSCFSCFTKFSAADRRSHAFYFLKSSTYSSVHNTALFLLFRIYIGELNSFLHSFPTPIFPSHWTFFRSLSLLFSITTMTWLLLLFSLLFLYCDLFNASNVESWYFINHISTWRKHKHHLLFILYKQLYRIYHI